MCGKPGDFLSKLECVINWLRGVQLTMRIHFDECRPSQDEYALSCYWSLKPVIPNIPKMTYIPRILSLSGSTMDLSYLTVESAPISVKQYSPMMWFMSWRHGTCTRLAVNCREQHRSTAPVQRLFFPSISSCRILSRVKK